MIFSFDVQLQVALRALSETVAGALGQADKHVVEQLHLAIATISFVKTRLPEARRYYRMELTSFLELAEVVMQRTGDDARLAAAMDEGQAALQSAEAEIETYEGITRQLRDDITALVGNCQDGATREAIERLVLDHSRTLLGQYRNWTSPFGFELKPEELPQPNW